MSQQLLPVLHSVILAEFDIDKGSTVRAQYPASICGGTGDTAITLPYLAEQLLPDGSEKWNLSHNVIFFPPSSSGGEQQQLAKETLTFDCMLYNEPLPIAASANIPASNSSMAGSSAHSTPSAGPAASTEHHHHHSSEMLPDVAHISSSERTEEDRDGQPHRSATPTPALAVQPRPVWRSIVTGPSLGGLGTAIVVSETGGSSCSSMSSKGTPHQIAPQCIVVNPVNDQLLVCSGGQIIWSAPKSQVQLVVLPEPPEGVLGSNANGTDGATLAESPPAVGPSDFTQFAMLQEVTGGKCYGALFKSIEGAKQLLHVLSPASSKSTPFKDLGEGSSVSASPLPQDTSTATLEPGEPALTPTSIPNNSRQGSTTAATSSFPNKTNHDTT